MNRLLLLLLACLAVLVSDQYSKLWLLESYQIALRAPVEVTPWFNLVMVWNRGVSFGLFSEADARWWLSALSIAISVVLLIWSRHHRFTIQYIATGMVIGGAVGNVIDRFHYGAVADFFDLHIGDHHWPAFNIADMTIVCGVLLLLFIELRYGSAGNPQPAGTKHS